MLSISDAIERHCRGKKPATQQVYRRIGKGFEAFCKFDNIEWHKAKYHNILGYLEWLKAQPGQIGASGHSTYCNKTIRRCLVVIAALYQANNIDNSVFDAAKRLVPVSAKPQKRITGYVPFNQVMRLFEACGDDKASLRNKAYMGLCFGGALRTNEATSLKLGDIKRTNKGTLFVHLQDTKTNVPAQQIIIPTFLPFIEAYKKERIKEGATNNDIFLTSYDNRNLVASGLPLGRKRMLEVFWRLCETVLGKRLGTHSMRATAITKMIDDGIPHRKIQDFSRHSSVSMVELYDQMLYSIDDSPAKKVSFK